MSPFSRNWLDQIFAFVAQVTNLFAHWIPFKIHFGTDQHVTVDDEGDAKCGCARKTGEATQRTPKVSMPDVHKKGFIERPRRPIKNWSSPKGDCLSTRAGRVGIHTVILGNSVLYDPIMLMILALQKAFNHGDTEQLQASVLVLPSQRAGSGGLIKLL